MQQMKQIMLVVGLAAFFTAVWQVNLITATPTTNDIIVTTTDDGLTEDNKCSLREALHNANNNSQFSELADECPAGSASETDVIILTSGSEYILNVAGAGDDAGDLDLLSNGLPLDLRLEVDDITPATIRANNGLGDRVLEIHGATVEIDRITLRGGSLGDNGGGILNDGGTLTLTNATLRDNVAQVGGGLYNLNGTAVISNSQIIFNNGALGGGGISNSGADAILTVQGTIIRVNVSSVGSGGGLSNSEGTALIEAGSNVNLNTAQINGGGVLNSNGGEFTILNSTVQSNVATDGGGGGLLIIDEGSSLLVEGSLIADNEAVQINAGRGGGVMVQDGATAVVRASSTINGNAAYAGGGVFVDAASLDFSYSGLTENTAVVGGGLVNYNSTSTLHAVYVYANIANEHGGGIINNSQLDLAQMTLRQNEANTNGGGIYNAEETATLTLNSVSFDQNLAEAGGAISNMGGHLLMNGGTVSANEATGIGGGGLYTFGGQVTINQTSIQSNKAVQAGGGIMIVSGSQVRLDGVIMNENQTQGQGGAIALGVEGSTLQIHQSQIYENQSVTQGGGIYVTNNAQMTMTLTSLYSNQAVDGAGIYVASDSGLITLNQSSVALNIATDEGGGMWIAGPVNLFNSTVSGNQAMTTGGLYLAAEADVDARHITLAENRPALFDLYKAEEATLELRSSIIATEGSDNCFIIGSNIVSLGHNISNDNSCGGLTEMSDQVATDPLLALLNENGTGTLSHALLANSPAIGAADAALCAAAPINGVDQRGSVRGTDSCDSGAYEYGVTLAVNLAGDGAGSVVSDPVGISCGAVCAAKFAPNEVVTLTAVFDAEVVQFTGWSGDITSEAHSIELTLDAAKNVTATFTLLPVPEGNVVYLPIITRP